MTLPSRGRGWLPLKAIGSILGCWILSGSTGTAYGQGPPCRVPNCPGGAGHAHVADAGTLGYGPPGYYPGFNGFGLGYHLGYGYGGKALGVGSGGGYPHYGGPGYPHCWPTLRRLPLLRIVPFTYYGGPGHPTPTNPNFYGPTGPLVAEQPVIEVGLEAGGYNSYGGYGGFTGVVPYPESTFAPFTTAAGNLPGSMGPAPAGTLPGNTVPAVGPVVPPSAVPLVAPPVGGVR